MYVSLIVIINEGKDKLKTMFNLNLVVNKCIHSHVA